MRSRPVRESILEINDRLWVVGGRFTISREPTAPSDRPFWSDGAGEFFAVSEPASQQALHGRPLSPESPIALVNDAGDVNAAWRIGEAFLKVQANFYLARTREHTTLDYLHDPSNGVVLSASTPRVLYHNEFDERYYLITTRVPGETLEKAWPAMDEAVQQACVDQIVDTCITLAQKTSATICGVDGGQLADNWIKPLVPTKDYSSKALAAHCREIGMDMSKDCMLYHCDLGPTNVLVDVNDGCQIGIVDWEVVGFVPKTWIRTKFCVCGAMNFNFANGDAERGKEWRQRVQLRLADAGFPEVGDAWRTRFWADYNALCSEEE
ncbi:hypothetical protein SPBR_05173 [Sporothrix brasiliensis 5110]|uniref:Aminoglycoside phosphotransferase domain-containing protein n=1 Tax=Sporothrix brasiliensis 5110 TaxID=1398154 RepID=A0A0C2IDB3_9PEZI|nr:uncharacterized protein SPBR_05173 [Sporothrix brasiliensis 5110]KIH87261.1 hypothetical protein SPBR_05173 [Sporothrix brasiliensis 5110]